MSDERTAFNDEQAKHPIPCLNCGEDTVLMHMLWHTQRRHLGTGDFRCNLMVKVEGDAKCGTCSNWGAGVGGGGCCPDCAGVKG